MKNHKCLDPSSQLVWHWSWRLDNSLTIFVFGSIWVIFWVNTQKWINFMNNLAYQSHQISISPKRTPTLKIMKSDWIASKVFFIRSCQLVKLVGTNKGVEIFWSADDIFKIVRIKIVRSESSGKKFSRKSHSSKHQRGCCYQRPLKCKSVWDTFVTVYNSL